MGNLGPNVATSAVHVAQVVFGRHPVFLYWAPRPFLELILALRSEKPKEVEILVLRHQLRVGVMLVFTLPIRHVASRVTLTQIGICSRTYSASDSSIPWARVSGLERLTTRSLGGHSTCIRLFVVLRRYLLVPDRDLKPRRASRQVAGRSSSHYFRARLVPSLFLAARAAARKRRSRTRSGTTASAKTATCTSSSKPTAPGADGTARSSPTAMLASRCAAPATHTTPASGIAAAYALRSTGSSSATTTAPRSVSAATG
jgi:hypothetical protein